MILSLQSRLEDGVRAAARDVLGAELPTLSFQYPPRLAMGDLALTAPFDLAKSLRQAPRAVVQAAAMFTLAAALLPDTVGFAAGYVTHVAALGLVRSAALVDYAPWTSQSVVTPIWWLIAAYYVSCCLLWWRRLLRIGVAGLVCALTLMLMPPSCARPRRSPVRACHPGA